MSERTTKYVTGTFAVTYHGRYVSADQIPGDLMSILDAALEDRDDLRAWNFEIVEIDEVTGNPEGYDDE